MKKYRRFIWSICGLFLALLLGLTGLGMRLSFRRLNQISSYGVDTSSLYGAVLVRGTGDYLLCRDNYLTGEKEGVRFPAKDEDGNEYVLRYLQETGALVEVYQGDELLRSEVWLWDAEKRTVQKLYSYSYGGEDALDGILMFSYNGGILVVEAALVSQDSGEVRLGRKWFAPGQVETPVELTPLTFVETTTSMLWVTAGQGAWFTDRYGNIQYCREDGTAVTLLENDGSHVSVNNVGYSITGDGCYFYNLDAEKDYWLTADGSLTEFDGPELDRLREQGFTIQGMETSSDGTLFASIWREDEPEQVAVIAPGQEARLLTGIRIPMRFWLPWTVLLSLVLTAVVTALVLGLWHFNRRFRVIPVSVRILAAVLAVLLAGGGLLAARTYRLLYANRLNSEQAALCDAALWEAEKLDVEKLSLPDIPYFESRMYETMFQPWTVAGLSEDEGQTYQREYMFGYFQRKDGETYPILESQYVTAPADYVLTGGELSLLRQALETEQVVFGSYTQNGYEFLAAYSPVFAEGTGLAGAVKCYLYLDMVKEQAMEEAGALSAQILLRFFVVALIVLMMIHISLRPLKQLPLFIGSLEQPGGGGAMAVRGHSEVSELIGTVNRMAENIRAYVETVERLKGRYGAFVPEDLVALFGTEDIRQLKPGDTVVKEAALVFINMADFAGRQERTGADEMFSLINQGLTRMIPAVKAEGGHIVRFFEGGLLVLFPGSAGNALRCMETLMKQLREECQVPYFAAMDYLLAGLQIIGCEERMDFTIRPEDWSLVRRLEAFAERYELGALLTGGTVERLRLEGCPADARALGERFQSGRGERANVYELLAGQEEEQLLLKRETKPLFETGTHLLLAGRYQESRECFARILRKNSRDTAARRYFDLCDRSTEGKEGR